MGWTNVAPSVLTATTVIVEADSPGTGIFVYSGTPATGNLIASIAPAAGTDPFGNAYPSGIADRSGSQFVNLDGGLITLGDIVGGAEDLANAGLIFHTAGFGQVVTQSGKTLAAPDPAKLFLTPGQDGQSAGSANGPGITIRDNNSDSSANLAVSGQVSSPVATFINTAADPGVTGSTVFAKSQVSTTHALTAFQADTTGTTNAAINAVSSNPGFSTLEVTGTETGRGTVKVAHLGYANGSDANAAALSIDLQTTVGGSTGTAAQGIFITSTTDAAPGGNAIDVRYNAQDWFVVKGLVNSGKGIVGIGVPTGHVPTGMLEINQKDTTTPGFFMQATAGGADLVQLQDSSSILRWQINNGGNMVARAIAFFTTNVIIGATSGDFGGAGSALTLCHTTDPTTNPAAGHIILYVDAAGNLLARTSAGNTRTVAAV